MKVGIGLSLATPAIYGSKGIPGDLYPEAFVAFDPVNSWYKIGNFGTSDLAEFLALPEVHFSSDPAANISASGYLPDAADLLYVEFANPGTNFTMLVEAMTTTTGADGLAHMFAAIRGYDTGTNFQGIGLGTSGNEAQPVMVVARHGSTGNGRLSSTQIDFFSSDPAGGPYRGAVTVSATTFAGWYGGAKTANFGNDTTLADANITRLYLGWGGICQLDGVETDEEPSLNHVRIVTMQTNFDEDAAEAWTA